MDEHFQETQDRSEAEEPINDTEKPERKSKKPLQTTVEVEPSAAIPAQFQHTDIGHIIKKSQTHQMNDDDREAALHRCWTPNINKRDDMPFSVHLSAQGKQVCRYLGVSSRNTDG